MIVFQVDKQLESGEYFLNENKKSEKKWQEKQEKQTEKTIEKKRMRDASFVPPEEPAQSSNNSNKYEEGKKDLTELTQSLKSKTKELKKQKKTQEKVNAEEYIAVTSGDKSSKKKSKVVDQQLESGEYFLNENKKSEKKWQEKQEKQTEKTIEKKRMRDASFVPPEEPVQSSSNSNKYEEGKKELTELTQSLKSKTKELKKQKKTQEKVNAEEYIAVASGDKSSKKKSKVVRD
ncbi:hypothetical protein DY000_02019474 [Brassica cretica]|uniref:Uncharacterized protein n=1 Tax=Brassica cretica TaxID=69181 RepID=A0ABQ7D2P2_BRACR|nr:hypothetical protein DY000_02019474 [Brassica cretica]